MENKMREEFKKWCYEEGSMPKFETAEDFAWYVWQACEAHHSSYINRRAK